MRSPAAAVPAVALALAAVALARGAGAQPVPRSESARGETVRFAVIGDYGSNGTAEAAVAALVHSLDPDFVATLGDNNYPSGEARTIDRNIERHYGRYVGRRFSNRAGEPPRANRFFPALGNHDWYTPGAQPYLDYFDLPGNERYYDVRRGPVHLFIVDSDPSEPDGIDAGSVQAQWLATALAASTAPFRLVLMHHAPYSSAQHGPDETLQWPYAEWGASAVLAGHDHSYERLEVGGLPYFVNGLGGAPRYIFGNPVTGSRVRFNAAHGAMFVVADDETCTFQFITRDRLVMDTFVLSRSGALLPESTIVPPGSTWRYLDDGTDPGMAFTAIGFDDSGWPSGPAELGYGDGDEATVIGFGPDPMNKFITSAFRHAFTVASPAAYSGLRLRVRRDDGAIAHLNGAPVFKTNMPPGLVFFGTPAASAVSGSGETAFFETRLEANALVAGANVLAVEVHQSDGQSSDLSLDVELIGIGGTAIVPRGSVWRYRDAGVDPGEGWRDAAYDDGAWASGPAQLGYGEADEATVIDSGPDPDARPVTAYFRRRFDVADPALISGVAMRLLRDDGAIVYLNGREVHRANLPLGAATAATRAGYALGGGDENVFVETHIGTGALVAGSNVIAVELHQSDPSSDDASFDLELVVF